MSGKKKKVQAVAGNRRTWKQEVMHSWPLYVLILPAFILALVFCYAPMGGLIMAFENYKPWLGFFRSEFGSGWHCESFH